MPKVGGLSLLNDRVFHVLVMTAHSMNCVDGDTEVPESCTVQIPVDFKSICRIDAIAKRSHTKQKGSSLRYALPQDDPGATSFKKIQKQSVDRKLTEGIYVSVERLRHALKDLPVSSGDTPEVRPKGLEYQHRWDMMTLSDAGGITRAAPAKTKQKEILDAIAADVEYVIRFIAETRKSNNPSPQNQVSNAPGSRLSR